LETELHSWALVPAGAPDDIKERWRLGVMRTFSPSGILEMDDGENWEHATAASAGYVTKQQKLYYGMNPGPRIDHPDMPGIVHQGQLSDANQRLFFKRYAEFMDAKDWSEITLG
jgi:ethylbenzene dioxygenase alpha subunit